MIYVGDTSAYKSSVIEGMIKDALEAIKTFEAECEGNYYFFLATQYSFEMIV